MPVSDASMTVGPDEAGGSDADAKQGPDATAPVLLASLTATPGGGIALDAENVYFTVGCTTTMGGMTCGGSSVMRVPKAGGSPSAIASGDGALALAIEGSSLYWDNTFLSHGPGGPSIYCPPPMSCPTNTTGDDLRSISLEGGAPAFVATNQMPGIGLGVQSGKVYWTSQASLMEVPPGGAPTALVTVSGDTFGALVADADGVTYVDDGKVMRYVPDGGAPVLLSAGPAESLATDGTSIFFTTRSCPVGTACGSIMQLPITGGPASSVVSGLADGMLPTSGVPDALAVDGDDVYWTGFGCSDAGCSTTVNRAARDGGATITLALNPLGIRGSSLALDDTSVYWLDFDCRMPGGEYGLCLKKLAK